MAKKPSRTAAPPKAGSSPFAQGALAPEDLEHAKREALLQLKIGRAAHLSTILVSALLAVDAVVLLFVLTTLPTLGSSDTGAVAVMKTYYLLFPLAGGLVLGATGLFSKWETFQFWPWETHFATSLGGFGVTVLAAVLYGLRIAGTGPTGHVAIYPALLPVTLAGTSAALVGLVLTWRPWGARQWISVVTGLAPVATAVLPYVHPSTPTGPSEALAVAFLLSAILYQTSGSFLHLVSSSTGAQEQAVVLSGQNRILRLATEVQQRDEKVRFREATLLKREAEAESAEGALRRVRDTQAARAAQLEATETGSRARAEALATRERDFAGRDAALEAKARAVEERAQQVTLRGEQLARQAPELAAREQRVARSEGELARRDVQLKQRAESLDRRESTISEGESRFGSRQKEIDLKTAELARREGEVTARERAAGIGGATPHVSATADLAAREARAAHFKTLLDEQNVQLGRRSKEVAQQAKAAETILQQISERQAHLVARESALTQREGDLEDRLKVADERRLEFETALSDYQRRLDEIGQQQVVSAQKGADLDRNLQAAADREKAIAEREHRLRDASGDLDRRESEIVLRERSLDADEAEMGLRRREADRGEDLPFAGLLAVAAADRAEASGTPPSGRAPARRRGWAPPAGSDPARPAADSGTLAAPSGRKYPDRLPTGTPRLDELLLGGLPPKSHVVLVGDAFSGKEVALYAFIAEGLKRSEPVVLVTASRSAAEVSESLGVVLPQFRGFEQSGLVRWVDASGSGPTSSARTVVVKSSDDRAGLLTALVQVAKQTEEAAKGGGFRVGFLGLSAVLAHADERASFSFLQNVVGILKPRNALAMYALEAGALSEAQVESLLGRMDGAIVFRQERDHTYLAVKGFGDVATRDWVEVRATSRSLVVGSFALERIR